MGDDVPRSPRDRAYGLVLAACAWHDAAMQVIFTSLPAEGAADIARLLLQERLVGCCNLIPRARSLYWWEGRVYDEEEVLAFMETSEERCPQAIQRLRALHPYSVPKILVLTPDRDAYAPPHAPGAAYAAWLAEVLGGDR